MLGLEQQEQLVPLPEKLLQGIAPDRLRARGGGRCPLDLDVLDLPLAGLSEP